MRDLAPWAGKTLLDLGCGSGYWLPGYAARAAAVIGVEPDPALVALAAARDSRVRVLPGSAEHIAAARRQRGRGARAVRLFLAASLLRPGWPRCCGC